MVVAPKSAVCGIHVSGLKHLLRDKSLKVTAGRLALMDLFEHANNPMSVSEIRQKLTDDPMDKVTVYRTINMLEKMGLVRKVRLLDRQDRYESSSKGHHHHLICQGCGKITPISGCIVSSFDPNQLKKVGFASVRDHSLEFIGICEACNHNSP